MKRKLRIFSNIAIIALSVCMFAFGVYAASTVSVTTSGTVTFEATGVFADVVLKVNGTETKKAEIRSDSPETLPDWEIGNIELADATSTVELKFIITNLASDRNIDLTFIDTSETSEIISKTVEHTANDYKTDASSNKVYNINPQATNVDNTEEITVTFAVENANASGDLDFNFTLKLESQENFTSSVTDTENLKKYGNTYVITTTLETDTVLVGYSLTGVSLYYEYNPVITDSGIISVVSVYENGLSALAIRKQARENTPYEYEFADIGEMAIKNTAGNEITSIGDIPRVINIDGLGHMVITTIGYGAFHGCSKLETVSLPKCITTIEDEAFSECRSLQTIDLPEGLKTIGRNAFWYCEKLELTSLPSGLTTIGNKAFENCSKLALTSLPSGLTAMGESAFDDCEMLAITSVPSGVTTLEFYVFYYCTSLTSISLPNGITKIDMAFYGCSALTEILYDGTMAEWDLIDISEESIPSGVTVKCSDGNIAIA